MKWSELQIVDWRILLQRSLVTRLYHAQHWSHVEEARLSDALQMRHTKLIERRHRQARVRFRANSYGPNL
jgi:hypothetical protein